MEPGLLARFFYRLQRFWRWGFFFFEEVFRMGFGEGNRSRDSPFCGTWWWGKPILIARRQELQVFSISLLNRGLKLLAALERTAFREYHNRGF